MKKQRTATRLTPNVYKNHNQEAYYFEKKSLTAYFIDERLAGVIEILHNRIISSILITAGLYAFLKGPYLNYIAVLLLVFGILELIFRKILSSCRTLVFNQAPEVSIVSSDKKLESKGEYVKKAVIFAVLGFGLILSLIFEGNQGMSLYVILGVAAFALIQSLLNFYWLFKFRDKF